MAESAAERRWALWLFYTRERAGDAQPWAWATSPLRCLAAALVPHRRGTQSRKQPCSKLRRLGHPQSWVCPGSFTQSATSIKVSCPSRSEVVQFQRGFIEHTKIRPGQISSLSFPSPHLSPPPYHQLFPPPYLPILAAAAASQPCTPLPSHPICPCVYSACVCMCVLVCVCQTAPAPTACQFGCFLFCASAPRLSTHLHRAERELEVQRARCQGHGRRLHVAHASPPSKQHQRPTPSSSASTTKQRSRAIGLCCTTGTLPAA